jgi:hypothetical protein
MNITDWIAHADLLYNQLFLIVMGGLYGLAHITGYSYETINIYCYFVFYPATFALFFKSKKKYLVLLGTLLFFIIPDINGKSVVFFDGCVDFINYNVRLFHSDYVTVCIYWCVLLPLLLYVPFVIKKFDIKTLKYIAIGIVSFSIVYMVFIYPNFKSWITYLHQHYANYI